MSIMILMSMFRKGSRAFPSVSSASCRDASRSLSRERLSSRQNSLSRSRDSANRSNNSWQVTSLAVSVVYCGGGAQATFPPIRSAPQQQQHTMQRHHNIFEYQDSKNSVHGPVPLPGSSSSFVGV